MQTHSVRTFDASRFRQRRENERAKFAPKKPKRWNHQDDLEALVGRRVTLVLSHSDRSWDGLLRGTLLAADPFTLKVKQHGSDRPVTVFKSALSYYFPEDSE